MRPAPVRGAPSAPPPPSDGLPDASFFVSIVSVPPEPPAPLGPENAAWSGVLSPGDLRRGGRETAALGTRWGVGLGVQGIVRSLGTWRRG